MDTVVSDNIVVCVQYLLIIFCSNHCAKHGMHVHEWNAINTKNDAIHTAGRVYSNQ